MAKTKGNGSIIKRGNGIWEVQVSLGKDPLTGKYRKITKRVHGTKTQANNVMKQLQHQKDTGIHLEKSKITVNELVELWLEGKRVSGTCSDAKIKNYESLLRRVCKYIGNMPISKIDTRTIEQMYIKIRKETSLSGTTMHELHQVLKSVFEKGVDYEIIFRNPCAKVAAPKIDTVPRNSLNRADAAKLSTLLNVAYTNELAKVNSKESRQFVRGNGFGRSYIAGLLHLSCISMVKLALASGMRRGELLALTWENTNLEQGTISVKYAVSQDGKIKEPKSKAGLRALAIDGTTIEHFKAWKETQASLLLCLGISQTLKTFVFCGNTGERLDGANFERWWRPFRKEIGFDNLKLHELRHTQATLLLSNGANLKMVQTRLGHSNASLTLNAYAHAIPNDDLKAAEIMSALMNDEEPQTPVISICG